MKYFLNFVENFLAKIVFFYWVKHWQNATAYFIFHLIKKNFCNSLTAPHLKISISDFIQFWLLILCCSLQQTNRIKNAKQHSYKNNTINKMFKKLLLLFLSFQLWRLWRVIRFSQNEVSKDAVFIAGSVLLEVFSRKNRGIFPRSFRRIFAKF